MECLLYASHLLHMTYTSQGQLLSTWNIISNSSLLFHLMSNTYIFEELLSSGCGMGQASFLCLNSIFFWKVRKREGKEK